MVYTVIKHCLQDHYLQFSQIEGTYVFFPVNIRARPLTRLHEISTARDWFQILLCPNRTHICFLRDGTFFKFPQSILTANLVHMTFFNQLDVIKTSSKAQCSLSPGRILSGQNFQVVPKIFSDFFSPSSRPPLPRQHTAALGSPQRQRFRGPAAPRGEGGRGCTEHRGPWPRKPHEAWDSVARKWMKMLMVQVFCQIFCRENQPKNLCTNIWCFLLPLRFLRPLWYSVQTRHVQLTILVWQYFGATTWLDSVECVALGTSCDSGESYWIGYSGSHQMWGCWVNLRWRFSKSYDHKV